MQEGIKQPRLSGVNVLFLVGKVVSECNLTPLFLDCQYPRDPQPPLIPSMSIYSMPAPGLLEGWALQRHMELGTPGGIHSLVRNRARIDSDAVGCGSLESTVKPWFESIIPSGNMLVIQSTCISKRISP